MLFDLKLRKYWQNKKVDVFFKEGASTLIAYDENLPHFSENTYAETRTFQWEERICILRDGVYAFQRCGADGVVYAWDKFSKVHIEGFSKLSANTLLTVLDLLHCVFQYRLLELDQLYAHSAAVVYRDECIMFCGMPSAGKSTQANLWKDFMGAWVLNYDKPALRKSDGQIEVCGTPWSGKEDCYINQQIKAKAIVFVEKASENSVRMLSKAEAYARVYSNYMPFPLSDKLSEKYERLVHELVMLVPVYELACTPDERAVQALYEKLYDEKLSEAERRKQMNQYRIRAGFLLKTIVDEYVVIARGEHALTFAANLLLNETGAYLWGELKEWKKEEELIASMLGEFLIDYDTAKKDIESFLNNLTEAGVLEVK